MKKTFPVYDICTLSGHEHDDLLISRFAPYLQKHHNLSLPHKHNFYHLVMFTKGGGSHAIDFKTFDVAPYQIYFMVPGQVHSWSFEGEVDGYVVNFSPKLFQSFLLRHDYLDSLPFFNGNLADQVILFEDNIQPQVVAIFEQLMAERINKAIMNADMLRSLLLQLFVQAARACKPAVMAAPQNYSFMLLQNFRKLVESHYGEMRLPKDYAALLYITPNHLNALCNDILGIAAGDVIRNRVLLEAKRLLINLDETITTIANRLNFADNSYFTKFFKKYEGVTPDEFRKNTLSNYHEYR